MARITLERREGGRADRLRKYSVVLDGEKAGKIAQGQRLDFDVEPGAHEVQLSIDWARSRPLHVLLGRDEQATLECAPNAGPLTAILYVLTKRNDYISLRRRD